MNEWTNKDISGRNITFVHLPNIYWVYSTWPAIGKPDIGDKQENNETWSLASRMSRPAEIVMYTNKSGALWQCQRTEEHDSIEDSQRRFHRRRSLWTGSGRMHSSVLFGVRPETGKHLIIWNLKMLSKPALTASDKTWTVRASLHFGLYRW